MQIFKIIVLVVIIYILGSCTKDIEYKDYWENYNGINTVIVDRTNIDTNGSILIEDGQIEIRSEHCHFEGYFIRKHPVVVIWTEAIVLGIPIIVKDHDIDSNRIEIDGYQNTIIIYKE